MTEHNNTDTFDRILAKRLSRRTTLKGLAGTSAAIGGGALFNLSGCSVNTGQTIPLSFAELPHGYDHTHHVAPGYQADILVRWGDPVLADAPDNFSGGAIDAASQLQQFGYNNHFIGFLPLPLGSGNSDRGLLCVNHEYCIPHLMFAEIKDHDEPHRQARREQVEIEMAAHGHSVIEINKVDGQWRVIQDSPYNRRITAHTEMELTGPAAGHKRLQTNADPTGRKVFGTLGNCAGGVTPWGTVLIAEENFAGYFSGDAAVVAQQAPEEQRNYHTFGVGNSGWASYHDRFNIEKEPREFNRFGWMVELDPYDPDSKPKKRTALGRFSHEGATVVAEHGKPVVAYSGDDGRHQCVYRFVSKGKYDKNNRAANMDLLAEGDLYVARFHANGVGEWLKITADNIAELEDPQEALIETRLVAKQLGATPMDRPEDIETNPATGRTYVMLTNNSQRTSEDTDPTNPRANNKWGQILEILPPGVDGSRDHNAPHFAWDMFVLAGNPNHPDTTKRGQYHSGISKDGWFSNPDNLAFDPHGRMWIATDGFPYNKTPQGLKAPVHDGLWACETTGENRALTRHFFGCPMGAELCGPCFTPDGKTLFAAVQHPGNTSGSSYNNPSTRWPDFDTNNPPRPSVVVITKKDGETIGS